MTSPERVGESFEKKRSYEKLKAEGEEQRERLHEDMERNLERTPEQNVELAKHEALEKAVSRFEGEQQKHEQEQQPTSPERRLGPITKIEREASFKATMNEVQSQMSVPSRMFSKVIHNKAIEKTSETIGSTIARPNAVLSGAVFAFVLTLGVYLVAKNFGYVLSGFETIGTFVLGWALGLVYDFLKAMVTGRK